MHNHKITCYSSVTVGTKGQIVIPAEARQDFKITTGDKLIIFGIKDKNMLGLCAFENIEEMIDQATSKLQAMRKVINQAKGDKE